MKVISVSVNELPKTCTVCPLKPMETHGCGTLVNNNTNGGASIGKKPDARCILRMVKEEDQVAAVLNKSSGKRKGKG